MSNQIKGWGEASMPLCARFVAEVRSLCQSTFRGVKLESPEAVCCARDCSNTLGTLQDLSTAALRAGDADAMTTCQHGHTTRLQPFVGMLPDSNDGHAAELMYWLRIVRHHVRNEGSAAEGSGDDDSSDDDGDGDGGDSTTSLRVAPMFTSLATALVRWTAHTFHEAGAASSSCPRVWVAVSHGNGASHDPALALRPVCEHSECLHAVHTHSRRALTDVTSLVVTHGDHRHTGVQVMDDNHASSVPLRTLSEHCGRVLAALTQATGYGDEGEQTLHPDSILADVEALLDTLPTDAHVSVKRLSKLHNALRKPLRWVQVVAHRQRVGRGAVDAQSHLWLCKHHAKYTEFARRQQRQHQSVEAVSMLVEWYWHDGRHSRVFDRLCTVALEHAWQSKQAEVTLYCPDHTVTVQFLSSGMVVKDSGARVGRVSLKTCVCVRVCVHVRVCVCACARVCLHAK